MKAAIALIALLAAAPATAQTFDDNPEVWIAVTAAIHGCPPGTITSEAARSVLRSAAKRYPDQNLENVASALDHLGKDLVLRTAQKGRSLDGICQLGRDVSRLILKTEFGF